MTLSIEGIACGPIETNAYIVTDEATNEALVIDAPPDSVDAVQARVRERGATVRTVVITHGHWDHIADTAAMARAFGAPVLGHQGVVDRLMHPSPGVPVPIVPTTFDQLIDEGDTVPLGSHGFAVLHLPGHDVGHIVLYSEPDRVFLGGDVLFPNGHGRTDIPGSDQAIMNRTIARLLDLPDDVVVYPGHGATTTIGQERPWMTQMAASAS